MNTAQKIIDIIKELVGAEVTDFDEKTDLGQLQINSLNFLKIVVSIEQAFDIEFDDEEINFELFGDIQEIAQLVDQKCAG